MATTINPVVSYRDLEAGARFLVETFGFVQHEAYKADDGTFQYVELSLNGSPLGLGAHGEARVQLAGGEDIGRRALHEPSRAAVARAIHRCDATAVFDGPASVAPARVVRSPARTVDAAAAAAAARRAGRRWLVVTGGASDDDPADCDDTRYAEVLHPSKSTISA